MPFATLVLGYLLVEPPLLAIRFVWRRCVWPLYAVEVLGALMLAYGWALLGWPVVASVNLAWALAFGVAFPLHAARVEGST
jgi:hypothetical protein